MGNTFNYTVYLRISSCIRWWLASGILFCSWFGHGQPGWNWGEQLDIAKEKNVLYTDCLKRKEHENAVAPHAWLLENVPDLNPSLYQNGVKIFKNLAAVESDAVKRDELFEKTLEMFDLRIKYFGGEANVMNRKLILAYRFYKGNPSKYSELIEMFARTLELNGPGIYDSNLVAYMDILRRQKKSAGDISDEQILDAYYRIVEAIERKLEKGENVEAILEKQEQIDNLLLGAVDLSCDFIESTFGSQLATTGDLKLAKRIFKLMLAGKCVDRNLAYDAAVIVNRHDPTYGVTKFLAQRDIGDENYLEGIANYKRAASLTDDPKKKSEIYMDMARVYFSLKEQVKAREYARNATKSDPTNLKAYGLIGDLYANSFEQCKRGIKKSDDYAVFIAAFDKYKLAGEIKGMRKVEKLFPTMEDIFSDDYKEGQTIRIGCWIGETVSLRRKPAE